nr:Ig-like domain-containing protein [Luteolibacter marinus]
MCPALSRTDVPGPPGSGNFGARLTRLPDGAYLVTDPEYDGPGANPDVGAVHLYNSAWQRIGSLTGSRPNDRVGSGGIVVLPGNAFAVISPDWDNGASTDAGAVTWCTPGSFGGTVSATNSLVGGAPGDRVGGGGITRLPGFACVVLSPSWDRPGLMDAGAATWVDPDQPPVGDLALVPSLVGATSGDRVGSAGVTVLPGGDYLVKSPEWNQPGAVSAGAITWCSGTAGRTGEASDLNSLVGSSAYDEVGAGHIEILENGDFVVISSFWDNGTFVDAGAATWANGASGIAGAISDANSLVGDSADDRVGSSGVLSLSGGDFVIVSPLWDASPTAMDAGAVTWGNAGSGIAGSISAGNSLVGTRGGDQVGSGGVLRLDCPGGICNYAVVSPNWDQSSSVTNVGAVTWAPGVTGLAGAVSSINSLTGLARDNRIGNGGVALLPDGNLVIISPDWGTGGVPSRGAATPFNGSTSMTGTVGSANSLTGSTAGDRVGSGGVEVLADGNFVVISPEWDRAGIADAGAVTWWQFSNSAFTTVAAGNSLVGASPDDRIGSGGVTALNAGSYVVQSPRWDNGTSLDAGAVTWCAGSGSTSAVVGSGNSMIGSTSSDGVGGMELKVLPNGAYVINSPFWDRDGTPDAGAVTWCAGNQVSAGPISSLNSIVGGLPGDQIGGSGIAILGDGNYLVCSGAFDADGSEDTGAVTWADGSVLTSLEVSPANSRTGANPFDRLGAAGLYCFADGSYALSDGDHDAEFIPDAGAITGVNGGPAAGPTSTVNSIFGTKAGGTLQILGRDASGLIVGCPSANIITLLEFDPLLATDGDSRDFGPVSVNTSSLLTLQVQVGTGTPAYEIIDTANPSPFTILSTIGPDVDGVLTLVISFAPAGPTANSALLQVGGATIALSGLGNAPPVFTGYTASTYHESSLVLFLTKMLRGAYDPDGDPFRASSVRTTTPGASVQVLRDRLIYSPPADFVDTDQFELTLTDSRGASSLSMVTVNVGPEFGGTLNPGEIDEILDGNELLGFRVKFQVIPHRAYELQRQYSGGAWEVVLNKAADPNGLYQYSDYFPPQTDPPTPRPSSALYRLRSP